MAWALVGTIGTAVQSSAGGSASPSWGASESRTAGNLLVLFCSITKSATLPTTPNGWAIAKQVAGTSTSATIFVKVADGSDTAPVLSGITSALIAAQLAEFSGAIASPHQSGSGTGTTSPNTATNAGASQATNSLMLISTGDTRSVNRASNDTLTSNHITTVTAAGNNNGVSSQSHYSFGYGNTNSISGADTSVVTLSITTSITGIANVNAVFRTGTNPRSTFTVNAVIKKAQLFGTAVRSQDATATVASWIGSVDTTYTTALSGGSLTLTPYTLNNGIIGQGLSSGNYSVYEQFFEWDTSFVGAANSVYSAALQNLVGDFTVDWNIIAHLYANDFGTLTTADWSDPRNAAGSFTLASSLDTSLGSLVWPALLTSTISKTGASRFMGVSSRAEAGTVPTPSDGQEFVRPYSVSVPPVLTVTWSTPALTADAVIKKTQTAGKTFTLDAFLTVRRTGTFTVNAVIKGTVTSTVMQSMGEYTTSAFVFGNGAATTAAAQSFVPPRSGTLTAVTYGIRKNGAPADSIIVELQSDSSGSPSGVAIQALETTLGSTLTTSPVDRTISISLAVTRNTTYWLVFRRSGAVNASNYYSYRYDGSAQYTAGSRFDYDGASWVDHGFDVWFAAVIPFGLTVDAFLSVRQTGALTADAAVKATSAGSFTVDAAIASVGGSAAYVAETGTYTTGTTSTTHVISVTTAPVTGDFLILQAVMAGGRNLTSVTDSSGNTWTVDAILQNTTNHSIGIASTKVVNALTTSSTITMTWSASNVAAAIVSEYSGLATPRSDVSSTSAQGTGVTNVESGFTATTAQANELLIGVVTTAGATSNVFTPDVQSPTWTSHGGIASSTTIRSVRPFHRIVSSTGTYEFAGDLVSNSVNIGAIVAYKIAAGGGPATVTGSFTADAVLKATITGSTTANAVLKATPTGSFTANAVLRATQVGSFTANAVVKATLASSFTADAVLKATITGSTTANAVLKKTLAATFTADAWLKRTQTGSLSADAVVKATQVGSTTANAVIKRSQTGTFTTDAVIKVTVTVTTFTANAVLRGGQTGTLTASAVTRRTQAGSFTVNAIIKVAWPRYPSPKYDVSVRGHATPASTSNVLGYLVRWAAGPSTGLAGELSYATGSIQLGLYRYTPTRTLVTSVEVGTLSLNYVSQEWNVQVEAWGVHSDTTLRARAWKTGNEPSDWLVATGVLTPGVGTNVLAAGVAMATDYETGAPTFDVAAVVKRTQAGSFTANAVLRATLASSFTLNAVIRKTGTGSFTADAVARKTQTGSFTASAVKAGTFTLDARFAGRFSLDAFIQGGTNGIFAADAIMKATLTGSTTVNAVLKSSAAGSFTANATLRVTQTGSLTVNAVLKASQVGSFTAFAVLKATRTGSFTSDAILRRTQIGSFTANAVLKATLTASFTVAAVIKRTQTGSFVVDAVLRTTATGSLAANALIKAVGTSSFTADAAVKATSTGSTTLNAVIKRTQAGSFTADAIVKASQAGSLTASALIKAIQPRTFTADAVLRSTRSGTFTTDAAIRKTQTGTFTADAVLWRVQAATFTADAVVWRSTTASFAANAVFRLTQASSFTLNAVIRRTQTGSFTVQASKAGVLTLDARIAGHFSVDAFIRSAGASFFAINAVIKATGTASFTANATIKATRAGTFAADSTFRRTGVGSTSVSAVIRATGTGSTTIDAVIRRTVSGTLTLDAVLRKTLTGSATLDAITKRTQTGSFSANAVLRRTVSVTLTADAVLRATRTGSFTADAVRKATIQGSLTAAAWVAGSGVSAFTLNAVVRRTASATVPVDAWIVRTGSGSFTVSAAIKKTAQAAGSLDAVVRATRTGGFATNAVLSTPRTGAFQANAYIVLGAQLHTFTADAAVFAARTSAFPLDAVLRVVRTGVSFPVRSVLRRVGAGSLSVDANITAFGTRSFTVNANIAGPGYGEFNVNASISRHIVQEIAATFSAATIAATNSATAAGSSLSARTMAASVSAATIDFTWLSTRRAYLTLDAEIAA